ncbi:MAG: hypothetical protein K0M45_10510 [Candidatus Paracaedibacteraceae bacterium]|nr:hypothetical protein [Candidatus Paracaedibacteraceae bacterium]
MLRLFLLTTIVAFQAVCSEPARSNSPLVHDHHKQEEIPPLPQQKPNQQELLVHILEEYKKNIKEQKSELNAQKEEIRNLKNQQELLVRILEEYKKNLEEQKSELHTQKQEIQDFKFQLKDHSSVVRYKKIIPADKILTVSMIMAILSGYQTYMYSGSITLAFGNFCSHLYSIYFFLKLARDTATIASNAPLINKIG